MKRYGASFAIIIAAVLLGRLPLPAHNGHDHVRKNKLANTARDGIALAQSGAQPSVAIKLFQYQPGRLQLAPGTTVTWVNEDDNFHSVTADKGNPGFDAPLDGKGKSFSFTFSQPGIYAYHCERHEHMRGEIDVR